jgi:hypothetical protein
MISFDLLHGVWCTVHSRWKRLFWGMFTSADEAPLRPRLARFPGDDPTAEGERYHGLAWGFEHSCHEFRKLTFDRHRLGVICILLCIALGIANLLHVSLIILFSAICL